MLPVFEDKGNQGLTTVVRIRTFLRPGVLGGSRGGNLSFPSDCVRSRRNPGRFPTGHPPVLVGLQDLAHGHLVVQVLDADECDREVPGDAVGPQRRAAATAPLEHVGSRAQGGIRNRRCGSRAAGRAGPRPGPPRGGGARRRRSRPASRRDRRWRRRGACRRAARPCSRVGDQRREDEPRRLPGRDADAPSQADDSGRAPAAGWRGAAGGHDRACGGRGRDRGTGTGRSRTRRSPIVSPVSPATTCAAHARRSSVDCLPPRREEAS